MKSRFEDYLPAPTHFAMHAGTNAQKRVFTGLISDALPRMELTFGRRVQLIARESIEYPGPVVLRVEQYLPFSRPIMHSAFWLPILPFHVFSLRY